MNKASTLTRKMAFAAGNAAANRQMRAADRRRWNDADYALANKITDRLLARIPFADGGTKGAVAAA